ncbi:MAG: hypothetical protein M0006_04820 [Magnetospirillum sp.]|nr:hypothetical protein [Magnetospirillum sp.]
MADDDHIELPWWLAGREPPADFKPGGPLVTPATNRRPVPPVAPEGWFKPAAEMMASSGVMAKLRSARKRRKKIGSDKP